TNSSPLLEGGLQLSLESAMPRFKLKGGLERSASADFFKNTVSQIPSIYGRLAYLASLRDPNTGNYRHHGLTVVFGREKSNNAMRDTHEKVFQHWLEMPLQEKHQDVADYLESLDTQESLDPSAVVEYWTRSRLYQTHPPASASDGDKQLFFSHLGMVLEILKRAYAVPQGRAS